MGRDRGRDKQRGGRRTSVETKLYELSCHIMIVSLLFKCSSNLHVCQECVNDNYCFFYLEVKYKSSWTSSFTTEVLPGSVRLLLTKHRTDYYFGDWSELSMYFFSSSYCCWSHTLRWSADSQERENRSDYWVVCWHIWSLMCETTLSNTNTKSNVRNRWRWFTISRVWFRVRKLIPSGAPADSKSTAASSPRLEIQIISLITLKASQLSAEIKFSLSTKVHCCLPKSRNSVPHYTER